MTDFVICFQVKRYAAVYAWLVCHLETLMSLQTVRGQLQMCFPFCFRYYHGCFAF